MTTPVRHDKGTARWHYISDGYNRYWYLRSALRWLSIVAGVTDLIVFAIVYHDWADYLNVHTLYFGSVLFIVAPLLSFVTSVIALTILFLSRRKVTVDPGWLLSLDLITGLLLATELAFNGQYWSGKGWTDGEGLLQVPWWFSLILGALHCILFLLEIWEVHVHRRMSREQRELGSSDDVEAGDAGSKMDSMEPDVAPHDIERQDTAPTTPDAAEVTGVPSHVEAPDNPSSRTELPNNTLVELPAALPARILVELPDGRIVELPEGSRVELPADNHPVELPDTSRKLRINTQPYDIDSASTASTEWYGSSPVAPSYRTQEWQE
ncbi:hypothetical protein QM012_008110 [Aureobasidium pullulans]|uniref:Uncharacterized protein n=1 Tax=Aureobasidium pullulans TaxID=5580 RepID=A0ABR0TN44_AURPU